MSIYLSAVSVLRVMKLWNAQPGYDHLMDLEYWLRGDTQALEGHNNRSFFIRYRD